jgi:hypothetical protein
VPAVLAMFNWPKSTDRYRRVERFVEHLFTNWDKLRQPPRHPKWRDVNLAATIPGWTRWAFADEMLSRARAKEMEAQEANGEFAAYVKRNGSDAATLTSERRADLFREFVQWRDQQRGSAQR